MRFFDEARIKVLSGSGGRGCVSFRREKFAPRGGPDGGDGGRGGDIILVADEELESLIDFRYKRHYKAHSGAHGKGKNQHGRNGADLIIPVPVGTLVWDDTTSELLKDLNFPGEQLLVVKGGRGGKGNARFVTSTRQAPRYAQKGEEGEEKWFRLELKLLADVGVIGLPNSGKSTLVSRISAAKPKIADYPFTTLGPCLGVVSYDEDTTFVIVDIPGLIEGAHRGIGLGTTFLRHIERTNILIHLIDGSNPHPNDPISAYNAINRELRLYTPSLVNKPQIVAINKMDLPESQENYQRVSVYFKGYQTKIFPISAATGKGIKQLLSQIVKKLKEVNT